MYEPSSPPTDISALREGFALLITLSVLTVVIALTAVMMGYLDSARKEAVDTKALIQSNLYFSDIKKILISAKNKKTIYRVLYKSPIPLQSEDGRFSIFLNCKSLDRGVNINWLAKSNNLQTNLQYTVAQKVFDALVQSYNIADPSLLEEILLQAMQGDTEYSESEMQSRMHPKNGITSYRQFMQLVERYQLEADDKNVGRINWRDYFVFYPAQKGKKQHKIAGDYLSTALIAILFDIDEESVKEMRDSSQGGLKKLLTQFGKEYDSKLFTDKFTDRSECEVRYQYQKEQYRFTFRDIEGEVKDFAFYGKQ